MAQPQHTQLANHHDGLRLVLPSDGDLYDGCIAFMRACGMPVERQRRRYTAEIPAVKGAVALFQRTADITQKVEEGSAELGVVGFDRFLEYRREGTPVVCLVEDLGFGRCDLVLAVPDSWLDVGSMNDLADLAVEFRQQGKQLRIATKYPRVAQRFLYSHGIYYFTLVQASGSLEAAPAAGYADLIVDLVSSGMTLRDNRLKTLDDGMILESSACLVGNREMIKRSERTMQTARAVLETIEGHLKARPLLSADSQRPRGFRRVRRGPHPVAPPFGRPSGSHSVPGVQLGRAGLVRRQPLGATGKPAGSSGPPA